jgi:hypothetical protein
MSAFLIFQGSLSAKPACVQPVLMWAAKLVSNLLCRSLGLNVGLKPAWVGVLQRACLESGVNRASQGRHLVERLLARLPGQEFGAVLGRYCKTLGRCDVCAQNGHYLEAMILAGACHD